MRMTVLISFIVFAILPPLSAGENFRYDSKNKRDPFRPLVDRNGNILPEAKPAAANVELHLEGIVWSAKGDSYAILGGMVVRTGDFLGDYKVKAVEKTKVILDRNGEISVINLGSEEE